MEIQTVKQVKVRQCTDRVTASEMLTWQRAGGWVGGFSFEGKIAQWTIGNRWWTRRSGQVQGEVCLQAIRTEVPGSGGNRSVPFNASEQARQTVVLHAGRVVLFRAHGQGDTHDA